MNDVLIVSLDKTLSKRLKSALEQSRIGPVSEATDTRVAIEYVKQQKPSLVVIDLFLPATSGVELLHKLKQNSDCHVMLITRVRNRHLLERAYRYGADEVLVLPFSDETFLSFAFQRVGRTELAPQAKA